MNNEPVAWIDPFDLERLPHHDCWVNGQQFKNSVPLYTYPAKTLTDKEIQEVLTEIAMNNENVYSFDSYDVFESMEFSRVGVFAFARAILKKASEK